jgi:sodium/potassium-transporting ATPase subunit alpha
MITREISTFINYVTAIGVSMGLLCFILAFLLGYYWVDAILFLIGVIVANVPEGLLAVITISLSLSASRLAKRNCVVKNLEAVETLGATSIILCDKTGTLTMNQASVAHVWVDNNIGEVDTAASDRPEVSFDVSSPTWKNMARVAVLTSRAEFGSDPAGERATMRREVVGTPIEAALLRLVEGVEGSSGTFRSLHPKVCEIPFSSVIKFQLSIHECQDFQTNGYLLAMYGDPQTVLNRCTTALVQGHERNIDDDYKNAFHYACTELGGLGERMVALADFRLPPRRFPPGFSFSSQNINFPLSGFRLLGIMAMIDPPRAAVPDSIAKCQAAGIKVIMMTGDHPATAKAIAKSVGILSLDQDPQERTALVRPAQSCLITGEELSDMTSEELESALIHHQEIVFAGFAAEQKLDVVEACQRLGAIVAVTGDGVNDSAALRKADVGIAMGGPSGTDVAKQAADIILLDDNFSSIVIAIEEGRIMFDNMRKSLYYMLSSNVAEIFPFLFFLVAQVPLPLGALTVLCIDLGTDMLPAISLAFEEEEVKHEVMKRGPRNPNTEGLVDERLLFLSCGQMGLIQAAAGLFTYFVVMAENGFWPSRLLYIRQLWDSRAINDLRDSYDQEWTFDDRKSLEYSCQAGFFMSIVVVQWVNLIVSRSRAESVFRRGMGNMVLNFALLFETMLAILLIYIPGLNNGLQMEMLYPLSWLPPVPFILFMLLYDEIRKAIIRKHPNGWMQRETCF